MRTLFVSYLLLLCSPVAGIKRLKAAIASRHFFLSRGGESPLKSRSHATHTHTQLHKIEKRFLSRSQLTACSPSPKQAKCNVMVLSSHLLTGTGEYMCAYRPTETLHFKFQCCTYTHAHELLFSMQGMWPTTRATYCISKPQYKATRLRPIFRIIITQMDHNGTRIQILLFPPTFSCLLYLYLYIYYAFRLD